MNQGNAIQSVVSAVDGIVNALESAWKGPDATEFQGWWEMQHRPALINAESAIHGLGQSALNNAQQQISASGMQTAGVVASAGVVAGGVAAGAGAVGGSAAGAAAAGSGGGVASAVNASDPPSVAQLESGTLDIGGKQVTYQQWCDEHGFAPPDSNYGQCAAYAAFRRAQLGLSTPTGNGDEMAQSVGLATSPKEIGPGSLISAGPTSSNPYGHVMVVDKVLGENPPRFQVSEMNAAGQNVNTSAGAQVNINADNYRTNSIVTLSDNGATGTITRTIVDGQGGTMSLGSVTCSKGV